MMFSDALKNSHAFGCLLKRVIPEEARHPRRSIRKATPRRQPEEAPRWRIGKQRQHLAHSLSGTVADKNLVDRPYMLAWIPTQPFAVVQLLPGLLLPGLYSTRSVPGVHVSVVSRKSTVTFRKNSHAHCASLPFSYSPYFGGDTTPWPELLPCTRGLDTCTFLYLKQQMYM